MPACSDGSSARTFPASRLIVPQNMPGAGSRSAANWLYRVAPQDGSVIACLGQATPTDQALGQPGVQFDARKFNWIGNLIVVNNILYVTAASGVANFAQAKTKQLAIGASGASSPSVLYPQVSNNLLGSKFKIIAGYPGGGDINIAVERHELDGRGSESWASMKATHPEWMRDHFINILFQIGPRRETDLPDVPLWTELAGSDDQRRVLDAAVRRHRGRPADPDRAERPGRSRQGVAPGFRRHGARPAIHRGGQAGAHGHQSDVRTGIAANRRPDRILAAEHHRHGQERHRDQGRAANAARDPALPNSASAIRPDSRRARSRRCACRSWR